MSFVSKLKGFHEIEAEYNFYSELDESVVAELRLGSYPITLSRIEITIVIIIKIIIIIIIINK